MLYRRKTIGCLEYVDFPEFGVERVLAKIDTGAYSGRYTALIYALRNVVPHKQRVLKFTPLGEEGNTHETLEFEETHIRSATGHRQKRFIITTTLVCRGKTYTTKIGLSDRRVMKREVLIGRRFLRENGITVDARINSHLDDEGDNIR